MKKMIAAGLALIVAVALVIYLAFPELILEWGLNRERKAAGLHEKNIRVDDHEIVYLEGGPGEKETILMVHGFAANKDNWTRFAKYITPNYHVIALDLPGFGNSTYLEDAAYGMTDQARRLDRFVNALGLKKFHIIGNSMGGHISARYAINFPLKVLSLGLFNAAGVQSPEPSDMFKIISQNGKNPLIMESTDDFDRLLEFVFVKTPYIPGFVKKLLIKEAQKHRTGNQRIFQGIRAEGAGLEPDLPKIDVPTLVLWGDRDRILHVSSVQVLAKGLPKCSTVIMKDCGHIPMVERPDESAGHYKKFLIENRP